MALAERFIWRTRLPLPVIVCGVPASGKTVLSSALADVSGLTRISWDVVRKQLAGVKATDRAPLERYSAEFSRATYAELGRLATIEVAAQPPGRTG
jgi:predicted kinase